MSAPVARAAGTLRALFIVLLVEHRVQGLPGTTAPAVTAPHETSITTRLSRILTTPPMGRMSLEVAEFSHGVTVRDRQAEVQRI
jgi:hypothetical protein